VRVLREFERPLLPGGKQPRQVGQVVEQRLPRGQKQPCDLLLNQSRVLYPRSRSDASRGSLLKSDLDLLDHDHVRLMSDFQQTHNVSKGRRVVVAIRRGLLKL